MRGYARDAITYADPLPPPPSLPVCKEGPPQDPHLSSGTDIWFADPLCSADCHLRIGTRLALFLRIGLCVVRRGTTGPTPFAKTSRFLTGSMRTGRTPRPVGTKPDAAATQDWRPREGSLCEEHSRRWSLRASSCGAARVLSRCLQ